MRLKRPLFWTTAAIAILAVAALLLLPLVAMTPWARGVLGGWIEGATGLPASVERLRLGFLRGPALEVRGLRLAQPPGFGEAALVEVGRARIELPWRSLFGGAALDSVTIEDAMVRPAVSAGGTDNWSALIERIADLGGEGGGGWSIGELAVERAALEFEDAAAGSSWRLTAITLAAEDARPGADFPVDLRLAGVSGPQTFHFAAKGTARIDDERGDHRADALTYRGWAGGEPLPIAGVELAGGLQSLVWVAEAQTARVTGGSFNLAGVPGAFEGGLELGGPAPRLQLRVKTEAFAPRAPAAAFGQPLPKTTDPKAFSLVQASFNCLLDGESLTIDAIEAQLDDTRIVGRAVPSARSIRLKADRIDLDRYLAPEEKTRREKKATLEAAVAQLGELDLDAEIRIDEARVAGAKLKDTILRIERKPGE